MKFTINIFKLGVITSMLAVFVMSSCKDDLPGAADTSSQHVELKSIKILNSGVNGDVVLEGAVDENTKKVSFPRIDTLTNFESLKFEAVLSDGATLEQDVFKVEFEEGKSEKEIILKVVSSPRYRDYAVNLRLKVPIYGGDFSKAKPYDYSLNELPNAIYPDFTGLSTRGTGFDGEHVLIVTRTATGPHLLKVSDLKNNVTAPIKLNMTGVTTGTFTVNMGAQVNGHTYVVNLSGNVAASPLKLYHWTDPNAAPDVIANINVGTIPNAGVRHGDNFSMNLDKNGNGYAYMMSTTAPILRLKVSNYTNITEPTVLNNGKVYGQWSSFLQVENTDNYLLTSQALAISVVSSTGSIGYTMKDASIPKNSVDARVVMFNGMRYLLVVTSARGVGESTKLYVYDINRGKDIVEALGYFEAGDKKAVFEYVLGTAPNAAPASQTGWFVQKDASGKDEKLMIYGAAADAGFAIIEVPLNIAED